MSDELIQFCNCYLLRNHELVKEDLWIRNGKIIDPMKVFFNERKRADKSIDCGGDIICAGFIDLQINGGYGVDFTYDVDTVEEGINTVARKITKSGVTSFCPTLITSAPETYKKIIPKITKMKKTEGATVLGIHLEGPFICPNKKGAHPKELILNLDKGFEKLVATYGSLENIKIITLAPELDPSGEVIRQLTSRGITVSLGHSTGKLEDGERAITSGANLITHLFNAMNPLHHRDPGLVGLICPDMKVINKEVYFGIIVDNIHTHPSAVRLAYRTNRKGLVLVTDAISALGLEDGVHHLGTRDVVIRNGAAYVANTDTLCGTVCPFDECLRNFWAVTECTIVEALECATLHPALCLNIEKSKGTLEFGTDADFVILDKQLNVLLTYINGECVYISPIEEDK